MARQTFANCRAVGIRTVGLSFVLFVVSNSECGAEVVAVRSHQASKRYVPSEVLSAAQQVGEGRDCGIRALVILLRLYGNNTSLENIMANCQLSDRGVSAKQIIDAASREGCQLELFHGPPEAWVHTSGKLIAQMEPTAGSGGVNHFVVVLGVSRQDVEILEPVTLRRSVISHRDFSQLATGYFLAVVPKWKPRDFRLTAVCISVLLGAVLFGGKRARRARTVSASIRLAVSVVAMFVGLLVGVGCSDNTNVKRFVPNKSVFVEEPSKLLGKLQLSGTVRTRFQIENRGESAVSLAVHSRSCSCLEAIFLPKSQLDRGQKGEVEVAISPERRKPGIVQEYCSVVVTESGERFDLQVSGVLPGVATPRSDCVIRPRDFKAGKFPPLTFTVFSVDGNVDFHLKRTDQNCDWIDLDLSQMKVVREPPPFDSCIVQFVTIPIRNVTQKKNEYCQAVFDYEIGGERGKFTIPILVIADD